MTYAPGRLVQGHGHTTPAAQQLFQACDVHALNMHLGSKIYYQTTCTPQQLVQVCEVHALEHGPLEAPQPGLDAVQPQRGFMA